MKRFLAAVTCVAALACSAVADDGGKGKNGNNNTNNSSNSGDNGAGFQGQLIGSDPSEHVAGVVAGGAPWVVANSEFQVSPNGRVQVQIRGLLLNTGSTSSINGTTGPVTMVNASVACGDVVAGTTGNVMLTSTGNASINDTVTLPSPCIAPILLIRIGATTTGPVTGGPFIAVNGIMAGNNNNNNNNNNHGNDH